MSSIQPVNWSEPASYIQSQPSASTPSSKPSDVPENVFAPPGVFARLTATLQAYQTSDAPRPEVVAKGKELAGNPSYPSQSELSQVVGELMGGKGAN